MRNIDRKLEQIRAKLAFGTVSDEDVIWLMDTCELLDSVLVRTLDALCKSEPSASTLLRSLPDDSHSPSTDH